MQSYRSKKNYFVSYADDERARSRQRDSCPTKNPTLTMMWTISLSLLHLTCPSQICLFVLLSFCLRKQQNLSGGDAEPQLVSLRLFDARVDKNVSSRT